MNKVIVIGNYNPSNHDASRVVLGGGIAPTIKENHGTVIGVLIGDKVADLTQYYVSQKGVDYIVNSKRGMATDVNPTICQPLTAKGTVNWTGSFVSPNIDHLEKSKTLGGVRKQK